MVTERLGGRHHQHAHLWMPRKALELCPSDDGTAKVLSRGVSGQISVIKPKGV